MFVVAGVAVVVGTEVEVEVGNEVEVTVASGVTVTCGAQDTTKRKIARKWVDLSLMSPPNSGEKR